MKKCNYCGKEYADDANVCLTDGQVLMEITPPGTPPRIKKIPAQTTGASLGWDSVPWFRQSGGARVTIFLGAFLFPPLLWAMGIICLTGDIYYTSRKPVEEWTKWSRASKIIVWILIVAHFILGILILRWEQRIHSP